MRYLVRMLALIGFLGGVFGAVAWAQFDLGSVVGTVKDPGSLPITGASVELRSLTTNVTRQATTSDGGRFDFLSLQPDRYSITVRQPGFREKTQSFELAVGQRTELDIAMDVGSVNEQITVAADAAQVETASSELSNVRTTKQVVDLPLNSRNFTQLVYLAPGVNNRGASSNSSVQGYTSGRGTNGAVINGAPPENTVYLFDGIQSVDTDAGVLIFFPPVDAIQEFKVQTSSAPAAYGGGQGIINVSFRSGTNALHGALYEFVRNSAFDAKNFFDSPTKGIPPFRLNQFGANIGGPVVIPHLFNGKNKLFFFADYEGKRVSQAQTYISTVPTDAFRIGNFAALPTKLFDPRTTPRTALPGNQVPTSAIDPTSARLMQLYPEQNLPGIVNNFLYNPAQITNVDQGDLRLDYRSDKSTLFGRFSKENPDTITSGYLPAPALGGGPSRPGETPVPAWQGVIGYGISLGPNKYYEARVGYSRLHEFIIDTDSTKGNLAEQFGIPNANAGGAGGLTNIVISGNVGLGDGSGSLEKINNNWEVDQAFSWVKGNHELKFGFDFMSRRFAFFSPTYPVGTYNFNAAYTGYGLSDFLFGHPISSDIDITKFFSLQRFQPSFYIQDNIRLTSKLTLNLGIRNDLVTPWKERHNQIAGFTPGNGGNLVPVGTPPYMGDTTIDGRYTNWGPRAGFAYSLTPKTVLRGGAGIFYAFQSVTSNLSISKNAPFSGSLQTTNSSSNFAAALPISAGFPPGRPALFPVAGTGFAYYPREFKTPSAYEWNINLQQQLWANDVLSIAYVGQAGAHIFALPNINQAIPGPGSIASRRPYPNLGDGTVIGPWGNSSYQSFQASYEHKLSTGLTFLGAYTWAHSIDDTSGTGSEAFQNPYDLHSYRGNSTFDVRHNLVLSWTYELPFGHGKRFLNTAPALLQQVAGGWQLNSIDTFQTGTPFTVTMLTSLLNAGSGPQWPNRIASGATANQTITHWFDPLAFNSPGQYTYGNSGRNILTGPGTQEVDLSLFKNFAFSSQESRRLQFRAEAFNVFNTPQFNNPNAQIGYSGVAQITSAGSPALFQRTSREIQLALKLYW